MIGNLTSYLCRDYRLTPAGVEPKSECRKLVLNALRVTSSPEYGIWCPATVVRLLPHLPHLSIFCSFVIRSHVPAICGTSRIE